MFIGLFSENLKWTEIGMIDNRNREHIRQFLKEKVKPTTLDNWILVISG
jgi:hypothetical protein